MRNILRKLHPDPFESYRNPLIGRWIVISMENLSPEAGKPSHNSRVGKTSAQ